MSAPDVETSPTVQLINDVTASNARRQRIFYRSLFFAIIVLVIIILFILWWRPYQFLIFSQTYSVGRCALRQNKKNCNVAPNHAWTIHGIWPASYDFNPAFCKNDKESRFNEVILESMIWELNDRWPSTEGNNPAFWRHEWEKHGTCALDISPLKSELQYFEQALNWNRQYSIGKILEDKHIRPDDSKKYQLSDLLRVLETDLGATVEAVCEYSNKREAYVLVEVRMCFSVSLTLTDCVDTGDSSCPEDDILYPATKGI